MPDTLLGLCRITFPPACSLAWLLRLVLVVLVVILATVALQVFSLLILLPIDQVFGSIALDEGPIGGAVPCRICPTVLQSNNVPRQLPQMSIAWQRQPT